MELNMVLIYINYINKLLEHNIKLEDITNHTDFRKFREENLITFRDARKVDELFFNSSGSCWTSAFNYPKEGERIQGKGIATDVGILTFNLN